MTSPGPVEDVSTAVADLFEQLVTEFPDIADVDLAACILDAREAVSMFGLEPSQKGLMIERIVRRDVEVRSGLAKPSARLMPETHDRGRASLRRDGRTDRLGTG